MIRPSQATEYAAIAAQQEALAVGDPVPAADGAVAPGGFPVPGPGADLVSGSFSLCGYAVPYWAAAVAVFALLYHGTRRHA